MAAVSLEDVKRIIDGGPVTIEIPYPLPDRPEGALWFMAQPTDWLYDLGQAVREAAVAEAESMAEFKIVKTLPPTAEWVASQNATRKRSETRLAELEKKGAGILPEEDLERLNLRDYINRLIDPSLYTRADEILTRRGRKAFEGWLMPRLIVDEQGKALFEMDTPDGQLRWIQLGRDVKQQLTSYFWQVLLLVQTAKNFNPGQNLN